MTIDEAIKHCEKVTEKQEYLSKQDHGYCEEKWNIQKREECAKCAADHRQLAEWLRELKCLRKRTTVVKSLCYSCHFYNQGYCNKDEIVIGENRVCGTYISHSSVLADEFVADICEAIKG